MAGDGRHKDQAPRPPKFEYGYRGSPLFRVSRGVPLGPPITIVPILGLGKNRRNWLAGLAGLQGGANQRGRSFRTLRPRPAGCGAAANKFFKFRPRGSQTAPAGAGIWQAGRHPAAIRSDHQSGGPQLPACWTFVSKEAIPFAYAATP